MATNQSRENGRHLRVTPTEGAATSGAPGRIGQRPGVAEDDLGGDGLCTMDFGGVYKLAVGGVDQVGNSAVAPGDILYFTNADTPKINKKDTGVRFGYANGSVASAGTGTIEVVIGY